MIFPSEVVIFTKAFPRYFRDAEWTPARHRSVPATRMQREKVKMMMSAFFIIPVPLSYLILMDE
jgi:hypothetical protein